MLTFKGECLRPGCLHVMSQHVSVGMDLFSLDLLLIVLKLIILGLSMDLFQILPLSHSFVFVRFYLKEVL